MRHLLLPPLILGIASPTFCRFRSSRYQSKTKEAQQTRFDALCIEEYADSRLQLENERLRINGSRGITDKQ